MGTQQSSPFNQHQWKYQTSLNDSMYGEIRVYKDDTQQFAVNCRVFQSQPDFEHHKQKMNKLKETNNIHGMIKLHEVYEEIENHLCSQFFKLYTVYDYYPHTLSYDLQARQEPYTSDQIIDFMQQIIHTLLELESKSLYHGDLRPNQIAVYMSQYKLKIPDYDQFQKMYLELHKNECYLSPQLFQLIGSQSSKYMQNNQNDVFTLGLVILEMGTLMKVHHCYDFDNQVLNTQNLQSMIQLFEQNSTKFLSQIVKQMLEEQADQRPTLAKLYENLMFNQLNLEDQLNSSRKASPYSYSSRKKNGSSQKKQQQSNLSNQLQPLINSKAEVKAVHETQILATCNVEEQNLSSTKKIQNKYRKPLVQNNNRVKTMQQQQCKTTKSTQSLKQEFRLPRTSSKKSLLR